MAIEIEINSSGAVQSIAEIKKEAIELRRELENATSLEDQIKYQKALGETEAKLKSINETLKETAAEKPMENLAVSSKEASAELGQVGGELDKVSKSILGVGASFSEGNIVGVIDEFGKFDESIKKFTFKELLSGLKAATAQAWQFTVSLLANPVGAIAAAVVVLAGAAFLLLKHFGLLNPVLDEMNRLLDIAIEYFTKLTDAIGLTDSATDKFIEGQEASLEATKKNYEDTTKEIQKNGETTQGILSQELAMLEASGASHSEIQAKKREILITNEKIATQNLKAAQDAQKSLEKEISLLAIKAAQKAKEGNTLLNFATVQKEFNELMKSGTEEEIRAKGKTLRLDESIINMMVAQRGELALLKDDVVAAEGVKQDAINKTNVEDAQNARAARERQEARLQKEKEGARELEEIRRVAQETLMKRALEEAKTDEDKKDAALALNKTIYDNEIARNLETISGFEAQKAALIKEDAKGNAVLISQLESKIALQKEKEGEYLAEKNSADTAAEEELVNKKIEAQKKYQAYIDENTLSAGEKIKAESQKKLTALEEELRTGIISEEQAAKVRIAIEAETNKKILALGKEKTQGTFSELTKGVSQFKTTSDKQLEIYKTLMLKELEALRDNEQKKLDIKIKALESELGEEAKYSEAYQQLLKDKETLDKEYEAGKAEIGKKEREQTQWEQMTGFEKTVMLAEQTVSMLNEIGEAKFAADMSRNEKSRDAELAMAKGNAAMIDQINNKYDAQAEGLKKKAFERNKKASIAETLINGAKAAVMAYASAPFPLNIGLAALTGITTLNSVAKIAAQRYEGGGGGGASTSTPSTSSLGGGGGGSATPSFTFSPVPGAPSQPTTPNTGSPSGGASSGQGGPLQVNVSISETEITSVQERNRRSAAVGEL